MQKDTGILMLLTPIFVVAVVSTVTAHVLAQDSCISFVDSGQNLGIDDVFVSALGDVDGDGDPDIVTVNGRSNAKVWLNDGSGYFTDSGQLLGTDMNHGVALRDLDGGNDLDAFATNYGSGNMVWLNDGAALFDSAGPFFGGSSQKIALGDLDGDGDLDAVIGGSYYYGARTKVYFNTTEPAGMDGDSHSSLGLRSHRILPNPFRGATRISYTTGRPGVISLTVYNIEGRKIRTVADGFCGPGSYFADFDATGLPSGVYLSKLRTADGVTASVKMVLIQ
jgi:hypothetical protein